MKANNMHMDTDAKLVTTIECLDGEILYLLPATKIQDKPMLSNHLNKQFKPLKVHLPVIENILQH